MWGVLRRSAPRFRAAAVPGTGGEGSPAGGVGLAFGGGMAPGRDRGGDGGAPAARLRWPWPRGRRGAAVVEGGARSGSVAASGRRGGRRFTAGAVTRGARRWPVRGL